MHYLKQDYFAIFLKSIKLKIVMLSEYRREKINIVRSQVLHKES